MLGDPGFILAASGGLFAALIAVGELRTALALAFAVAAAAAVTALAKVGFMAFGPPSVYSPSGHAAMATTFFLCLGAIAARARGLRGRPLRGRRFGGRRITGRPRRPQPRRGCDRRRDRLLRLRCVHAAGGAALCYRPGSGRRLLRGRALPPCRDRRARFGRGAARAGRRRAPRDDALTGKGASRGSGRRIAPAQLGFGVAREAW